MTELAPTNDVGERLQSLRPALLRVHDGGPHHEPEDLVQEAFLRALSCPDMDPDRLPGWLRTVIRNLGHDELRRNRSATTALARLAKSEVSVPDPADVVVDWDLAQWAAEVVRDLPPVQQTILCALAEGRSIDDVAGSTGLSRRGVEGHLRRARQTLRKKIAT